MGLRASGALACALAVLAFAPAALARSHAVIAFLPPSASSQRPLLEEFAARGMAIGMTSPTVGGFEKRQMALDMSQGTRIPTRLYSGEIGALRVRGGRLTGWPRTLRRADEAPGDLKPGLLATTIERIGGRVGYRARGGFSPAPIVAANRNGGVTPLHPGDTLEVVDLSGLAELDRLMAAHRRDFVYVVRSPYGKKLRLLPSAVSAPGVRGRLRSATTRRDGLIAATDVAPTILRFLGIPVPSDMQGQRIEGRGRADAHSVEQMAARLSVVTSRRGTALEWIAGAFLVALALTLLLRSRFGLRLALLTVMWVPGLALLAAAIQPSRIVESALVGVGAVLLAALSERLVGWPAAPALPAAAVFLAHAVDLARGSPLIGFSMAGPNPAGGARFFGIGNELEAMLSLSVLIGAGALLARLPRARAPLVFALVAIVAAGIMGAGRLGADVGAVITLGAGGAAAVIAALPEPPSRRVIALGIAAPIAAVVALILVDVISGGGAHLTRSVLHAHGSGDLVDVVRRRFDGSFSSLSKPGWAIAFVLAVVAIAWLAARGRAVLSGLPRPLAAGLVGAWFAGVVGAISNDSGPLILEISAVFLLSAYAYVRVPPETGVAPR